MATADPNDFSMLTEEELRPWAVAPEVDALIEKEQRKLLTTMQSMNPTGGYEGASEIDTAPDVLIEFEKMVREDPEWIGETEEDEDEYELLEAAEGGDYVEDEPETSTDLLETDDGLLTAAIDELNYLSLATDETEDPMMSTLIAQSLIPQSLATRKARPYGKSTLKNLKSIKFSPNFGGPALHKVKAAGVSTLKVPQNRSHYERPSTSSSYSRKDNLRQARRIMSNFEEARPSTSGGSKPADSSSRAAALAEMEKEMAALREKMEALKKEEEAGEGNAQADNLPSLFAPEEKDADGADLGDVLAPSPIKKVRQVAAADLAADTASPNILDNLLSKSASAPELRPTSNPRKLSKIGGKSPRSPKDRFEKKTATSGALGKMGISNEKGTSAKVSSSKATDMFGKKRLKSIRTLRDQMMSTAGTMTAFSRNDDPEQAKLFDAAESIRMTREQCVNTMKTQKFDSTWDLLVTPGYLKQVGPENVFKSDSHMNYISDARYEKAIDPRTFDHSNGIPPSPLRVWAEDAVKSGRTPLFSSGGAIRV